MSANEDNNSSDSFEDFGGDGVNYNRLFMTDTCFASRDEAFDWAQKIAFGLGFALVKATNGAKNRKQPELLGTYFRCARYRRTRKKKIDPDQPDTPVKPKKKGTTKCMCMFRVRAVQNRVSDLEGKELIVWNILTAENGGYHNHDLAVYKDGDRLFAGLDAVEKEFVREQVRASIPPRDIKNCLYQRTPDKPQPTSSQIYSEVNKVRREIRGSRNDAQQMLAEAVGANYVEWHKINPETKEISHVFMSHPEAVKLFRAYPRVVLIDSTYKTNVYKCALVELVGVTPCGSSFLIVIVLLPSESDIDYSWMLERLGELLDCTGKSVSAFVTDRELGLIAAIEAVYPSTPHILCRWHLNRALEKKALKNKYSMWLNKNLMKNPESGWNLVIDATFVDEFRRGWEAFSSKWEELATYVYKTWGKYVKKWALCYTNQYFHLGNTATSRVESAHSLLKAWLKSANINLDTMWFRIHSMLESQHSKIRYELEQSRSRPRSGDRIFSLLQGKVSIKAIGIMEAEIKRGSELGIGLEEQCGCALRVTHGLPCACGLIELQRKGKRVHLDDVHEFWKTLEYDNGDAIPNNNVDELEELIAEARSSDPTKRRVIIEKMREGLHPEDDDVRPPPVRENPKGRPRGSTTRNKSGFEHSKRKCGTRTTNGMPKVPHMVGDFDQGLSGAPLEVGYTKGLLSTWSKKEGVPKQLWSFFDGWVDVGDDGHCGFRVISHAARGRESDHLVMRERAITEIKGLDVYKDLFGYTHMTSNGFTYYDNTLRCIDFSGAGGCGSSHWMHVEHLFVFASLFNWVICVIAQNQGGDDKFWDCHTYLPLRMSSQNSRPYGVLWIVNYHFHWMRLYCSGLLSEVPMPSIDLFWEGVRGPSVAHFEQLYKTNFDNWHAIMGTTPKVRRKRGEPRNNPDAAKKLNFDDVIEL